MKMHWTDVAIATALAAAGCVAIYAGLTRAVRRAVAEQQRDHDLQLRAIAATVKALQTRVAELSREQAERAGAMAEISAAPEGNAAEEYRAPKPEIVAALTAAATTFLGKKARVRQVKLPTADQDGADAWAQQGRVIVQTSHNLRANG